MKPLIYIIAFLFIAGQLFAQLGDRFYGPTAFQEIQPSGDGNFYVIGTKANTQAWLLKIDPDKNIIWEKTYFGPAGEYVTANHLMIDSNGDLLIVGAINKSIRYSEQLGWAMKADSLGNLIWSKTYSKGLAIFYCCPNGLGGYYLGSYSASGAELISIKSDGSRQSITGDITFRVVLGTKIKYLDLNADGTITVIGRDNTVGVGFEGIFLVRIKKDGTQLIKTTFITNTREDNSSFNYSMPLGVIKKQNGNYVITNSINDVDCLLIEMDKNGKIISNKIYGQESIREYPYGLTLLSDGDLLISGETEELINNNYEYNPFLIRVSPTGVEKWRKYYKHGINNARLFNGVSLPNGNLMFCGMATKDTFAYLFTIEGDGNNLKYTILGNAFYDVNGNCIQDGNDYALGNIIVNKNNGFQSFSSSDNSGNFSFKTDDVINDLIASPPDEYTKLCISKQKVTIDTNTNSATVQFLVSPTDQCSHVRVQITQPDLVKCNKSKYLIYVKNFGGSVSDPQQLIIRWDSKLSIVDYTPGGQLNQNSLIYDIPVLQINEELVFEFVAALDCNVLIGASHLVTAEVQPSVCPPIWIGSRLTINGECLGDRVKFTILNTGADMINDAEYRVFADQYFIEQQPLKLNANQSFDLEFETKGKTFHVEIVDPNAVLPPNEYVYSTMEACGKNKNDLYSTTFANAYRSLKVSENRSVALGLNGSGIPDRVQEMIEGLGFYHFITENGWMEYTVRAHNQLDKEVNQIQIQLNFNSSLDINSFQILGNDKNAKIVPVDNQNLNVILDSTHLGSTTSGTNADVFFKFRIKAFNTAVPDSPPGSYVSVDAKIYYADEGPFPIRFSWNNFTKTIPYTQKEEEKYPEGISLFGGKYPDFGSKIARSDDGSVFLFIETLSYNDYNGYQSLVIKLDKQSKVIWYSVLPVGKNYSLYSIDIIALADGGCMLLSDGIEIGKTRYLWDWEAVITRVNNNGDVVFSNHYKPGINQRGGQVNNILQTKDGNFLVCGVCSNSDDNDYDHFLMKIDPDGKQLWLKNYIMKGTAYEAMNVFELENGDLICAGYDGDQNMLFEQKTNSLGNQIWLQKVRPQLCYWVDQPSVVMTKDEEIVFLMYTSWQNPITGDDYYTPHFTKFDKNGHYVFEKRPIITDTAIVSSFVNRLITDKDGNFYSLGYIYNNNLSSNFDALLAKFDSNLNLIWYKQYGNSNDEMFIDAVISDDNIIHLIGYNQERPPDFNLQTIYVKTDLNGDLVKNKNIDNSGNDQLLVYPNPAKDKVNVFFFSESKLIKTNWELIDLNGQLIMKGVLPSNKLTLDVQEVKEGIYFLRFSNFKIPVQKIIIQH